MSLARYELDRVDCELTEALFRIETQALESRNLLVLAGQVGLDATAKLLDEAEDLAGEARDVDLDWREADVVSASSLQVLLALGVSLSERGRAMRITADNPDIRRLLELAGLSTRFPGTEPVA